MFGKKYSTSRQVFYFVLIVLAVILLAYGGISWFVYSELESICANATGKYPGDKVDALIKYLNDGSLDYKGIHRVIWALGEIRDERALTTLEELLHNPHTNQKEVRKAIKKINGDIPNPYFWRKILNDKKTGSGNVTPIKKINGGFHEN